MSDTATIADLGVYLARLHFDTPPAPTLDTLRELQHRHTAAIAFETVDTLLRRRVAIDLPAIERKVLHQGRGGYCYELNQLFLALLRQLGFEARPITGRVVMGGPENAAMPRTHLLSLVTLDGVGWIADVGFGRMVPTAPLRLDTDEAQPTPHEPYRVVDRDGQFYLSAQVAGEWRPLYVFDLQPQSTVDFEVGNWYVCTHPASPFVGQLLAARTGPGVRHTFQNGAYGIHRVGEASERRQVTDVDETLALLRGTFGIQLPPDDPALQEALAEMLARQAATAA